MMTFHQAIKAITAVDHILPVEQVGIENAWNRVLREDIYSDVDMPPFDKAAMDGYACRKTDLGMELYVKSAIYAGQPAKEVVNAGECVKIMTGAPVPEGADTVIMTEDTEAISNSHIRFTGKKSKSNICKFGEDVRKGDKLLAPGSLLLPHHIALLASAGYSRVRVSLRPEVALVSTGNELIEPDRKPSSSQIRNSNAYNLLAQLMTIGITAKYAGIIQDNKPEITGTLNKLLKENDLVIFTGGASAGEHDYITRVFDENGLEVVFSKLAIQPGKPVSFATGSGRYCFGLSGNPVSSFLQFELLVKPFIFALMGSNYEHPVQLCPLAKRIERSKADRLKFFPVHINSAGMAEEIKFNGSAHIAGLTDADGFGLFPKDCYSLLPEENIEVLRIR